MRTFASLNPTLPANLHPSERPADALVEITCGRRSCRTTLVTTWGERTTSRFCPEHDFARRDPANHQSIAELSVNLDLPAVINGIPVADISPSGKRILLVNGDAVWADEVLV